MITFLHSISLCHQAVQFDSSQRAVRTSDWEGNRNKTGYKYFQGPTFFSSTGLENETKITELQKPMETLAFGRR